MTFRLLLKGSQNVFGKMSSLPARTANFLDVLVREEGAVDSAELLLLFVALKVCIGS